MRLGQGAQGESANVIIIKSKSNEPASLPVSRSLVWFLLLLLYSIKRVILNLYTSLIVL